MNTDKNPREQAVKESRREGHNKAKRIAFGLRNARLLSRLHGIKTMAPMVNTKLIEAVEAEWRAIGRQADAKRRTLASGQCSSDHDDCGQPALRAVPPFMQAETDLDREIRQCGKRARERMRRAVR